MMEEMMMNLDPEQAKMHMKYKAWTLIGVGALILINQWWLGWEWWTFIGWLVILLGILKIYHIKNPTMMAPAKKKKRR